MTDAVTTKDQTITILNKKTGNIETMNLHTGELIDSSSAQHHVSKFLYSPDLCEAVCNAIADGDTLTNICKMEGVPPKYIIARWRQEHPEFDKLFKQAMAARAMSYHDRSVDALEEIDSGVDEETAKTKKMVFDGFMKLAEKNDPAGFSVSKNAPHLTAGGGTRILIINTGIDRSPDSTNLGSVEATAKIVEAAKKIEREVSDGGESEF